MTKYCKSCDTHKEKDEFYISNTHEDGLGYYCKDCTKEKSRESWKKREKTPELKQHLVNVSAEWRKNNREKFNEYQKVWKKKNKDSYNEYQKLYQREYRKRKKEKNNGNNKEMY